MALEGVDYSYSRPSPSVLVAAGKRFVARYITDPAPGAKGISQDEYDRLTAAGLGVAFVWENGPNAATLGFKQGVADATHAQANLNRLKGASNQRPLYFAVDCDVSAAAVADYFKGVVSVIGRRRTGVYGSYRVCVGLRALGLVGFLWQTYAWSFGKQAAGINLYQYRNGQALAGGEVDLDRALTANYGQKAVIISKPAPKPAPAPIPVPDVQPVYYTVRAGDTLTAIAAQFGHSLSTLVGWNHIVDPNKIDVGQRLRVA